MGPPASKVSGGALGLVDVLPGGVSGRASPSAISRNEGGIGGPKGTRLGASLRITGVVTVSGGRGTGCIHIQAPSPIAPLASAPASANITSGPRRSPVLDAFGGAIFNARSSGAGSCARRRNDIPLSPASDYPAQFAFWAAKKAAPFTRSRARVS